MKHTWSDITARRKPILVVACIALILVLGAVRLSSTLFNGKIAADVQVLGANTHLQLGGENKTAHHTTLSPLQLSNTTAGLSIADVKAGHYHTLLLTNEGSVYALGNNAMHAVSPDNKPLIGTPTKVVFPGLQTNEVVAAIDTSRDHNIALTNQGRVFTWGSNYTGQLGDDTNTDRGTPEHVKNLPTITRVAAGYRHSAAISDTGDIYGWGGVCTTENASQAQKLIEQAASNIAALGGYGSATQADLHSNDVGDCTTLQSTFVQSRTPKKLQGLDGRATNISAGYGHILALNDKGEAFTAGCNTYGQLGRTKTTEANKNNLAKLQLTGKAKVISAGYRHSAIALEDGTAWQWGYNGHGLSLHVGMSEQKVSTPTQVKTQHKFISLEAAHDTTFGVTTLGDILGWGQDDAQAFWASNTIDRIKTISTAKDKKVTLSGGMQHVVLAIK